MEKANVICKRLGVRYVIMGHTHETELRPIGSNGEEYFNTGTWTKVFRPDEDRLIADESELVFVQAIRKSHGLQVRLLKWKDEAVKPQMVKRLL